jgi:hypothetical protein
LLLILTRQPGYRMPELQSIRLHGCQFVNIHATMLAAVHSGWCDPGLWGLCQHDIQEVFGSSF